VDDKSSPQKPTRKTEDVRQEREKPGTGTGEPAKPAVKRVRKTTSGTKPSVGGKDVKE